MYNLKEKIKQERQEMQRDSGSELPIDYVFPEAIDQHSNRIDSWRSYNSDLDGDITVDKGGCCSMCCNSYNRYRVQYYTWPLWWFLYHISCCCLCQGEKSNQSAAVVLKMQLVKKKLKQLKRRKVNEDLRTIYAMIQLLKKSEESHRYLQKIRINPKL